MKMCQIPLYMDNYKMGGLVTIKEFIWRIAHVTLLQGIKPFYESFQKLPKFINTRTSGRYAPLILAPAESSSLKPCTLDYLII